MSEMAVDYSFRRADNNEILRILQEMCEQYVTLDFRGNELTYDGMVGILPVLREYPQVRVIIGNNRFSASELFAMLKSRQSLDLLKQHRILIGGDTDADKEVQDMALESYRSDMFPSLDAFMNKWAAEQKERLEKESKEQKERLEKESKEQKERLEKESKEQKERLAIQSAEHNEWVREMRELLNISTKKTKDYDKEHLGYHDGESSVQEQKVAKSIAQYVNGSVIASGYKIIRDGQPIGDIDALIAGTDPVKGDRVLVITEVKHNMSSKGQASNAKYQLGQHNVLICYLREACDCNDDELRMIRDLQIKEHAEYRIVLALASKCDFKNPLPCAWKLVESVPDIYTVQR